jgi:peptide deformylase
MAVRTVLQLGDPGLREVAKPVENPAAPEIRALVEDLIDHLDGILAVDRITDIRTMCTREEFEKRYRAASPYAVQSVG